MKNGYKKIAIITVLVSVVSAFLPLATMAATTPKPTTKKYFDLSWDRLNKASHYKAVCTTKIEPAKLTGKVSKTDKNDLVLLNQILPYFKIKNDIAVDSKSKVASLKIEMMNVFSLTLSTLGITDRNKRLAEIKKQAGTIKPIIIDSKIFDKEMYLRFDPAKPWYGVKDDSTVSKDMSDLSSLGFGDNTKESLAGNYDKKGFYYLKTEKNPKGNALSVFRGKMSTDSSKNILSGINSAGLTSSIDSKNLKVVSDIYVDSKTMDWKKSHDRIVVKEYNSTKKQTLEMAVVQDCSFDQTTPVNVVAPTENVQWLTGEEVFTKLMAELLTLMLGEDAAKALTAETSTKITGQIEAIEFNVLKFKDVSNPNKVYSVKVKDTTKYSKKIDDGSLVDGQFSDLAIGSYINFEIVKSLLDASEPTEIDTLNYSSQNLF